jgi:ABC-type phosphate/phosphonate transport system substrate-binding protein
MWRKSLLSLAVVTTLALAAPAGAQDTAASARPTYSDSQMQDFARATVDLQALGSQSPTEMTRAIEGAGMSVADYNSMGDAMRADPALAGNLNPYLEEATAERRARVSRAQYASPASTPPAHHARTARRTSVRHVRATTHSRSHKTATRHHTTARSHHAAKRTHHVATSHPVRHRHRKA